VSVSLVEKCGHQILTVQQRSSKHSRMFTSLPKKYPAYKQSLSWSRVSINHFHLMNACLVCIQQLIGSNFETSRHFLNV